MPVGRVFGQGMWSRYVPTLQSLAPYTRQMRPDCLALRLTHWAVWFASSPQYHTCIPYYLCYPCSTQALASLNPSTGLGVVPPASALTPAGFSRIP